MTAVNNIDSDLSLIESYSSHLSERIEKHESLSKKIKEKAQQLKASRKDSISEKLIEISQNYSLERKIIFANKLIWNNTTIEKQVIAKALFQGTTAKMNLLLEGKIHKFDCLQCKEKVIIQNFNTQHDLDNFKIRYEQEQKEAKTYITIKEFALETLRKHICSWKISRKSLAYTHCIKCQSEPLNVITLEIAEQEKQRAKQMAQQRELRKQQQLEQAQKEAKDTGTYKEHIIEMAAFNETPYFNQWFNEWERQFILDLKNHSSTFTENQITHIDKTYSKFLKKKYNSK